MLMAVLKEDRDSTAAHLIDLFNRTVRMVEAGIRPVYVIDGQQPALKSAKLNLRKRKAFKDLLETKDIGRPNEIDKLRLRTSPADPETLQRVPAVAPAHGHLLHHCANRGGRRPRSDCQSICDSD